MENSIAYYGATFLEKDELEESNINHKIELKYYATKKYINQTNEEKATYGIQIIKNEYKDNEITTECSNREYISDSKNKVIEIIETLKKFKVTPIGLNDVLEDLLKVN